MYAYNITKRFGEIDLDMKYIDANKLKTGITKERKNIEGMFVEGDNTFWDGQDDAYCYTLALIDSLQQEQQENKSNLLKSLEEYFEKTPKEQLDADWEKLKVWNEIGPDAETYCKALREQQEEPDKNLEEAAYKYSFDSRPSIYGQVDVIDAFKAGAEWQARQLLQGSPMPEDTVLFQKGVAEGRRLEREDMLKDAEECELYWDGDFLAIDLNMVALGYSEKDKVKVIVLKAEEE